LKSLSRNSILIVYAAIVLIPFSMVLFTTFKSTPELYKNPLGLPESWSLANYKELFLKESMTTYFMNSVIVTVVSVSIIIFLASLIAYAIFRMPKKAGYILFGFFVIGMMVPTQVNMIPIYMLVNKIGLLDTHIGVILVTVGSLIPIAVFILSGFMKTLPEELIEAAKIDGAGEWKTYAKVVVPLSLPSIATVAIFAFVIVWNDLLYPLLLLKSAEVKTLPIALLSFQGQYMTNYPMIFSGVIIASIPMIIAYVFMQRYFIAGMTAGSIK
jgi:raffinose/stachyose/melibiose transport system permease protein